MEWALWALVAVVAWFGLILSNRVREILKELTTLRELVEKEAEFKKSPFYNRTSLRVVDR